MHREPMMYKTASGRSPIQHTLQHDAVWAAHIACSPARIAVRRRHAMTYADFYRHSVEDPSAFWDAQARLIDWHEPYSQGLNYSRPPFARWFDGGKTNLCYNAVDRWLATQADAAALISVSADTGAETR